MGVAFAPKSVWIDCRLNRFAVKVAFRLFLDINHTHGLLDVYWAKA